MSLDPTETKLAAARTKLILDKPFLGALVLRLPMVPAGDWCTTTATDAKQFYYNPEYIDALSLAETQFTLAHEALHCALSHFARRMHRQKHRWDLACDLAINPLLKEEGLKPPPGALIIEDYQGLTAEEIYPLLTDDEDKETLDDHVYDKDSDGSGSSGGEKPQDVGGGGGGGDRNQEQQKEGSRGGAPRPDSLTPDERETLQVQWQQRMAGAAQQAMQAGRMGGALARMIDHLLQPQLPWRMLLARYLSTTARDDYSYMRPSRREGEFILPSLRSHEIDLVVAVDTSSSVSATELSEFIAEINAIKGQIRARVTLLGCDAQLAEECPWVFEPWEEARVPETLKGGGGTDFRPVFDWVRSKDQSPASLIYFTDADGAFPKGPPTYPVIWLVKGKLKVPWGERVQLN